jgi:hypothetical protein
MRPRSLRILQFIEKLFQLRGARVGPKVFTIYLEILGRPHATYKEETQLSKVRLTIARSTTPQLRLKCVASALLQALWKTGRFVAFWLPYSHGLFKKAGPAVKCSISFSHIVTHFIPSDPALISNGTLNLEGWSHD